MNFPRTTLTPHREPSAGRPAPDAHVCSPRLGRGLEYQHGTDPEMMRRELKRAAAHAARAGLADMTIGD